MKRERTLKKEKSLKKKDHLDDYPNMTILGPPNDELDSQGGKYNTQAEFDDKYGDLEIEYDVKKYKES